MTSELQAGSGEGSLDRHTDMDANRMRNNDKTKARAEEREKNPIGWIKRLFTDLVIDKKIRPMALCAGL